MNRLLALIFILGTATMCGASTRSPITAVNVDLHGSLKTALGNFQADTGRYPSMAEGLAALVQCPTNFTGHWRGPYLETVPLDPWGEDYIYCCPGIHNTNTYDIFSRGADGRGHDQGNDPGDINNWDPSPPQVGHDIDKDAQRNPLFFGGLLASLIVIVGSVSRRGKAWTWVESNSEWTGILSAIWFVLGLAFFVWWAGHLHFHWVVQLFSKVFFFWWGTVMLLALSGLSNRSTMGVLAGVMVLGGLLCYLLALFPPLAGT
jgi:type II secretion system protein G